MFSSVLILIDSDFLMLSCIAGFWYYGWKEQSRKSTETVSLRYRRLV